MYLEDLKKDFYEFLTGKQIVLVVHYDIDSICTCKILQSLLRHNNVTYTLSIVKSISELKVTFRDTFLTDVKYYVLINCGGTCDLVDVLEPPDDVTFFVLDSHRPLDLCNIYSNGQVRIVARTAALNGHGNDGDDEDDIPRFADVFREESDDEDEDGNHGDDNNSNDDDDDDVDSETIERAAKRRRINEDELDKRREKRLWEDKRNKILFEYSQFTYYAKASAIVMYELAWLLNKEDVDSLWLASVAITEQFLLGKIETTTYVIATTNLQAHVNRLSRRQMTDHHGNGDTTSNVVSSAPRMTFENDMKLVLYRHWSIFDSLKYSPYTACKMKLWSHRGAKKLQELLADMGFPLVQSRQTFQSMDLQLRKEFRQALEKMAEKYDIRDVTYPNFVRRQGYRQQYAASDIVYALLAILESTTKDRDAQECFNVALDCLSSSKSSDVMDGAIQRAKVMSMTIFKMVQAAVDMKQIVTAGPFIYYIIQEGCLDWSMFSHQHVLSQLAHFILTAYVSMSRNKKAPTLPLIVSAPKNPEDGTCVVMGIPPLCENSPKNFFGKAFEQAAMKINCDSTYDYFDTSYFEIFTKDRTRFFDALTSLLT